MHSDNEMVNLRSVIETLCYMVDDDSDGVEEVMQLPSIDIVRCAECIWRDKDNQGEDYCTYVKGLADITDDSFCSWGERNRR